MDKLTVDLPTMYGDHHVTEVREILLKLPGVDDVYASSAFQQVQVSFDKKKAPEKDIILKLAKEQGYVPDGCLLGGGVVMGLINKGENPCKGCNCNRSICKSKYKD